MEMTVWQGRRWSAANAYLRPALKRPNVQLRTGARAEKIIFEGRRAVGVQVRRWGRVETVRARKEVIVAASAINSPQLLMLSGIGPADQLRQHGIEVVANRPGVGANLQDHLEVYVQQACTRPITLNAHLGLLARAKIGFQWFVLGNGLGATNHFEACAFIRSKAGVPYPDLQMHFLPAAVRYDGHAAATAHGFQVHIGPMRSPSRGSVRLASSDPRAAPTIRFNYMSTDEDWRDFRTAIRLTREIFAQPAFDEYRGAELAPGARRAVGRRARRLRARECGERLSSVRDVPHGRGRRRELRGRRGMPGDRHAGAPRRRFLDLPRDHQRQHQRAVDHGGREGRRHDPGQAAASRLERPAVDAPGVAGEPALACSLSRHSRMTVA